MLSNALIVVVSGVGVHENVVFLATVLTASGYNCDPSRRHLYPDVGVSGKRQGLLMFDGCPHLALPATEVLPGLAFLGSTDGAGRPRDLGWMFPAMAQLAHRQFVPAETVLFSEGDAARHYSLVVSGEFLAVRGRLPSRPIVRFLRSGDLVLGDCDGRHIASCYAVSDSIVLRIERQRLDQLSALDPALTRILRSVHAADLEMLLQSPGNPDLRRRRAGAAANRANSAPSMDDCGGDRANAPKSTRGDLGLARQET